MEEGFLAVVPRRTRESWINASLRGTQAWDLRLGVNLLRVHCLMIDSFVPGQKEKRLSAPHVTSCVQAWGGRGNGKALKLQILAQISVPALTIVDSKSTGWVPLIRGSPTLY